MGCACPHAIDHNYQELSIKKEISVINYKPDPAMLKNVPCNMSYALLLTFVILCTTINFVQAQACIPPNVLAYPPDPSPCSGVCTPVTNGATITFSGNSQKQCIYANTSASIIVNYNNHNNDTIKVCSGAVTVDYIYTGSKTNDFIIGSNATLTFDTSLGISGNLETYRIFNYGIVNFNYNYIANNNTWLVSLSASSIINFNNGATLDMSGNQNQTSIYLNGGTFNIDSIHVSNSNNVCLSGGATFNANKFIITGDITINSGGGCINILTRATLNHNPVCNGNCSALNVCMAPGSKTVGTGTWGTGTQINNNCAGCSTILPVNLISFSAVNTANNEVGLTWTTAFENNTDYFEIQRSSDSRYFVKIAGIPASGNSTQLFNYSYTDQFPQQGINYYRLKIVDKDGHSTLSSVKAISMNATGKMQVITNYNSNSIVVMLPPVNTNGSLRVIDIYGRILFKQKINGEQQLNIPIYNLLKGNYFVQYITTGEQQSQHIVILI
jgi:hypothetical protein